MEEKLLQMKSLVEKLNQASDSYYNGKGELMTDYEWDALFDSSRDWKRKQAKFCLTPLLIACQKILS